MKTFKRILVIIGMVIAAIFLVLNLVGIFGSWVVNERATNSLVTVIGGAETILTGVNQGLQRAEQAVSTGRDTVQQVQGFLTDTGVSLIEGSPARQLIEQLLGEDLIQKVNQAGETVRTVIQAVYGLNDFLESLNSIPFVDVPTLTENLQSLEDRVNQVMLTIQDVRLRLQTVKTEVVETVINPIVQKTEQIDSDLAYIETNLQTYIELSSSTLVLLADIKSKIPLWLDILTIIISFAFLWMILAQSGLILIGYNYLKTGQFVFVARQAEEKSLPDSATPLEPQAGGSSEIQLLESVENGSDSAESPTEAENTGVDEA